MKGIKKFKVIIYMIMIMLLMALTLIKDDLLYNGWSLKTVEIIIYFAAMIIFEVILYEVLKIIKTVQSKDSFNFKNVQRFNKMYYFIWILAIFRMITNYIEHFSIINLSVALLIILALFSRVLSNVFIEAYKLKHYEEELRQEKELTI